MAVKPEGSIRGSLQDDGDFYFIETKNELSNLRLRDSNFSPLPFDDGVDQSEYEPEQQQIDVGQLQPGDATASVFQERIYPAYRSGKAIIDILLYYDITLKDADATLDYIVELGNYILQLTEVNTEIRIVATKPVEIPASMKNQDILEYLKDDIEIAEQRRFYGADLVHVVRATNADTVSSGNCGIAYYTVSNGLGKRGAINAGVTQWSDDGCYPETFVHEIGHNLGSAHNREEEGGSNSAAAYSYSYGKLQPGSFGTVMAYRDPSEDLSIFSSPDFTCNGYSCGSPTASFDSADNRRSILNTRFIVAGYEGKQFYYESVQEYSYSGGCNDDPLGTFEGMNLRNSSRTPISIRAVHFLTGDGSVYSSSNFEKGEYQVDPGGDFGWGWCDGPVGTDVREGFFVYENPINGALVEGRHVFFDDDYSGGYASIKVASSLNGKVVGHPARTVRSDGSKMLTFTPNSGFELSGVSGTCTGSVRGNTFTVQNTYGDCTVIPQFKAVASSDDVFRVSLEEPVPGNTYTGIRNLRGWALGSSGIDRLEVFIDGVYQYDIPYGGLRGDVANVFPEVDGSANSGFSMAFGYTNLSVGEHVAMIRATTSGGSVKESSSAFQVANFHKPFIGASDTVNLSGGTCQLSGDMISVTGALIDGQSYDLALQWRTAAQDFEIIEIEGDNNSAGFAKTRVAPSLAQPVNSSDDVFRVSSDDVFRVSLEEPVQGDTYTGIRNLRGWALASSGIEKIEVFIDGVYQFDIPHGGVRGDVGNAFPEVAGSGNSGFSMAYGYTNLSAGEHVATIRATSKDGSVEESSKTFIVAKFHKPFIRTSDTVNLSNGSCQMSGDKMSVAGALIDGQSYDMELQWRIAAQDFEIMNIK
ncbi:zinc-dependent metalloprotease [Luminiphilus sp.]|nr:zinc-dependent metalloprotease [Luminiphilus sp.]